MGEQLSWWVMRRRRWTKLQRLGLLLEQCLCARASRTKAALRSWPMVALPRIRQPSPWRGFGHQLHQWGEAKIRASLKRWVVTNSWGKPMRFCAVRRPVAALVQHPLSTIHLCVAEDDGKGPTALVAQTCAAVVATDLRHQMAVHAARRGLPEKQR